MVKPQSVQGHTDLTHPFEFFDIRALCRSGLSARVPDQYGTEGFGRLIFAIIRKMWE